MHEPRAILISNGRIIDPANRIDAVLDLRIVDGRIQGLGPSRPSLNRTS